MPFLQRVNPIINCVTRTLTIQQGRQEHVISADLFLRTFSYPRPSASVGAISSAASSEKVACRTLPAGRCVHAPESRTETESAQSAESELLNPTVPRLGEPRSVQTPTTTSPSSAVAHQSQQHPQPMRMPDLTTQPIDPTPDDIRAVADLADAESPRSFYGKTIPTPSSPATPPNAHLPALI